MIGQLCGPATSRWRLLSVLAVLAATKVAALLVFTSGFLLTRVELPNKSACADFPPFASAPGASAKGSGRGCWLDEHPIDKVVLLIIDGARFDFAMPSRDGPGSTSGSTRAPLHVVAELLEHGGVGTGQLFKFVGKP